MTRADEAARWLAAAREDLDFSRYARAGGFHAQACFHAQQAAEKSVKAVHFDMGARAVIGHNLRNLIARLDPPRAALSAHLDGARELDLLYVPTRYPNGLDAGTPAEAFSAQQSERAIGIAMGILEAAAHSITS